jgi:hypothetical protein
MFSSVTNRTRLAQFERRDYALNVGEQLDGALVGSKAREPRCLRVVRLPVQDLSMSARGQPSANLHTIQTAV